MSARARGKLEVRAKFWLELDGRAVFGDGKARLLEEVQRSGSLAAAAEAMGMSYRTLWGRLREMERRLGFRLVSRRAGGPGGGGSTLTAEGRELLRRYRAFRRGLEGFVQKRFEKAFGKYHPG